MTITAPIPREEQHLMRKAVHKMRDKIIPAGSRLC